MAVWLDDSGHICIPSSPERGNFLQPAYQFLRAHMCGQSSFPDELQLVLNLSRLIKLAKCCAVVTWEEAVGLRQELSRVSLLKALGMRTSDKKS